MDREQGIKLMQDLLRRVVEKKASDLFITAGFPPAIKIGLEIWPNPIAACLIGYVCSTLTVLTVERVRNGRFIVQAPWRGRLWFAATGICNGVGTLMIYAALGAGPVSVVAPLVAAYPMVTVGLNMLVFGHTQGALRLAAGAALTVLGVVLILIG